jgi:hypothetical protein
MKFRHRYKRYNLYLKIQKWEPMFPKENLEHNPTYYTNMQRKSQ